jgi:hypothetical protein
MPAYITVTAPEGRTVPINPNDGSDPAGSILMVTPERICRVRYSGDVRRYLRDGDLLPVKLTETVDEKGVATYVREPERKGTDGKPVPWTVEDADSPRPLAIGDRVDVVADAPPPVRADEDFDRFRASVTNPTTNAADVPSFDTTDTEGK